MKISFKAVLVLFIFVALALSVLIGIQRFQLEKKFKQIEIAMSLNSIRELSMKEGYDENNLLKQFQSKGISGIAIQEDTIETLTLQGKMAYFNTNDLIKLEWVQEITFPGLESISQGKYLLVFRDYSIFRRIKAFFQSYLEKEQVQENTFNGHLYSLLLQGDEEELLQLGLGFSYEDIQKIETLGFNVILRPKNVPEVTSEMVQQKLLAISGVKNSSTIIFDDEEVLGYPSKEMLSLTAGFLRQNNLSFGIIEFTSQDGIQAVASEISKFAVRVHSITKEEMEKIPVNVAIDRWIRAAQERNIRIFYLNPFLVHQDGELVQRNLAYVGNIRDELSRMGYQLGKASLFPEYEIPIFYLYILALGIISAGFIVTMEFIKMKDKQNILLFLASLILLFFLNFFTTKILVIKVLALAGSIIFPVLAIIGNKHYFISHTFSETIPAKTDKIDVSSYIQLIKNSISGITRIMLVSSIGGLLIGALLTNYQFILAVQQFSGIKIAYIFPLMAVVFYLWWNSKEKKFLLIEDLKKPILFEHVLLVFIFLVFVVIYISRSGNFSFLPVLDVEEKMRLFLEKILVARPRSKEFLIGYPLLSLAIAMNFLNIHYLKYPIIIMGTVAPVTIINTFCHVHTSIYLSLLRTFHGYWLGMLFGIFLISIFFLLNKFFKAWFDGNRNK